MNLFLEYITFCNNENNCLEHLKKISFVVYFIWELQLS
jgi:hypothetical protein